MQETKRTAAWRVAFAWLLAVALAFGLNPAFAVAYEGGASASTLAEEQAQVSAKMAVYGPVEKDGTAVLSAWASAEEWTGKAGSTAADLSAALLESSGLEASYDPDGQYGFYLESIVGPDGKTYSWDSQTGSYWALYVNGKASSVGASSVVLEGGDVVSWVYCNGAPVMPSVSDEEASLPSFEAAWGNNGGSDAGKASSALPTMSKSSKLAWKQTVADISDGASASVSDLLVVDGLVYSVASTAKWSMAEDGSWVSESTNAVLRAFDAEGGSLLREVTLPSAIDSSACRLAYSDGVIAIPLSGGSVVGVAADTLAVRWNVPAELEGAQSLNTVGVDEGRFLVSYSQLDENYKACASRTLCIDAKSGEVDWAIADDSDGMYWGGFAFVGDYVVMGTDSGVLKTVELGSGKVVDTMSVGASVRSTPVAYGSSVLLTTNDGTLHKVEVSASGKFGLAAKASFAASSTCTPSLIEGKAVVGGATQDYKGVLASVDVETMTVDSSWNVAAEPKGRPVVSVAFDGVPYAYFTCNAQPGALYGVGLVQGSEPFAVCTPEAADSNWCMASPVSDNEGRLFYTNDAGVLFAVSYDRTCGYSDVEPDGWYVASGDFEKVVSSGLMSGENPSSFQPYRELTRAEVVTVLYRAAGSPAVDAQDLDFSDVSRDEFYWNALAWASSNGIATGYEDGSRRFGPYDKVSREQLATFLGRFAEYCGKGDLVAAADSSALESMPDYSDASDWTRNDSYLAWCCDEKIITGVEIDGVGYLDPQGVAQRCMMAKMIVRTLEALA